MSVRYFKNLANIANIFTAAQTFRTSTDGGTLLEFQVGTNSVMKLIAVIKTYDVTSALFDAAATTDTVEVMAANANREVVAAAIYLDTQFVLNGDRTTLTVTLGENAVDGDDVIVAGSMNLSSDTVATKYSTRGVLWSADETGGIINRVIDADATVSGGTSGNLASMSAGQITVVLLAWDWS